MVVPISTGEICPMCKQPKYLPDARTPGQESECGCSIGRDVLSRSLQRERIKEGKIVECNCCGDRFNTAQGCACPTCKGSDFTEISSKKVDWEQIQRKFLPPVC